MDQMVLKTQQWLNNTYRGRTGYVEVSETGNTGWATISALMRAMQIEFGITATSSNFGPTTTSRFNSRFPNGIQQQADDAENEDNIYAIIQGALWCKGYSTGANEITRHFYGGTGRGIKEMKRDAGMQNPDSTVTIEVMKALLSMRQFKKVAEGDAFIRQMQQYLNRTYPGYINYGPCDGIYGREMAENLIIALQAIEGLDIDTANGNFGPTTKRLVPILPYEGTSYTKNDIAKAIKLVRFALYCNGIIANVELIFNEETWTPFLQADILEFQRMMCLPETRKCDLNTWMSLFTSRGNPDRSCNACDTVYSMRDDRLDVLESQSISVIGRYIVGGDGKEIDEEEIERIINRNFKFFPIYQTNGIAKVEHFTKEKAREDVRVARIKAKHYCIPKNSIIYFAVDCDPVDSEIYDYILPYFEELKKNMGLYYKIGVYGTRNVCSKVMKFNLAETCFVSDMSTGYSGNMGFKMPDSWNLDQFDEITLSAANGNFGIDKVTYSERFPVVESLLKEEGMRGFLGDVEFTRLYRGPYRTYSGNKLKLYVSVEEVSPNFPDGAQVIIVMRAHPNLSNPITYPEAMEVIAKPDGKVYSFKDTMINGEPYYDTDYMKIESGLDYRIEYAVILNGEAVDDVTAKVHIEVETDN